ncbi:endonuclease I family protein [Aeoliella sp. SH292]|uniref:endonuclease I family protein n=1 Tax=Aeoliella sp. SH292 TaxID=3454464 RepID=UPI003F95A60B
MDSVLKQACTFLAVWLFAATVAAQSTSYSPPASYYNLATGSGATLKSQLTSAMSAGHVQRNYGDLRYSAAITDRDPNNSNNILLVYNRASVPATWDNGSTWNREHLWPQSLQPGEASNSTKGALADPHALRPADPGINSSRGNKPFGSDATTGAHRSLGTYYFPGDADKGDIARSMFYMDTRWASSGLSLTDNVPSSNQMGDLSSLLAWHYLDPPDEFERRRNHAIYSQSLNPTYYTNNRNAYIDHPEFVWSIYVDQANDSRITLGGATANSDGSSILNMNFGRAYVGQSVVTSSTVTLNKAGLDGTYYEVTTSGIATGSVTGGHNAFRMGQTDSRTLQVGLNTTTATAGLKQGQIVIDNLDITTQGGVGRGANDANDTIQLSLEVVNHPVASLSANAELRNWTFDLGEITQGSGLVDAFDGVIANLAQSFGGTFFAADLDLDAVTLTGGTGGISVDLLPFPGLAQGEQMTFSAFVDTATPGTKSAEFSLLLSGENLPGAQSQVLSLSFLVDVLAGGLAGDFNSDGLVNLADYSVWRDNLGSTADLHGNGVNDGIVNSLDYDLWKANFGNMVSGPSVGGNVTVPEPSSCLVLVLVMLAVSPAAWRQN